MSKWKNGIFIREKGQKMLVKIRFMGHIETIEFEKKDFTMKKAFEKFDEMAESVMVARKI